MAPVARFGTSHGAKMWVNLEPCGLLCGMMTWVLLLFGMYATTYYTILPWLGYSMWGCFHLAAFNGGSVFGMYCHWVTMTTDPGSVPRDCVPLLTDVQEQDFKAVTMEIGGNQHTLSSGSNRTRAPSSSHIPTYLRKYRKFCKRCRAFKPIRAHHCSICGRCIVKMDHHCPWVNNCIGIGNQKLFLLFLLAVNISCIYSFILVIAKFMSCSSSAADSIDRLKDISALPQNFNSYSNADIAKIYQIEGTSAISVAASASAAALAPCGTHDQNIMIIFLLLEALLFGLFTLCMMGDQTTVLSSNQTQIDKLKGDKHEGLEGYNEVFGCDSDIKFRYDWLIPFPPKFPNQDTMEQVLGYRMLAPGEIEKKSSSSRSGSREESPNRDGGELLGGGSDRDIGTNQDHELLDLRKRNGNAHRSS